MIFGHVSSGGVFYRTFPCIPSFCKYESHFVGIGAGLEEQFCKIFFNFTKLVRSFCRNHLGNWSNHFVEPTSSLQNYKMQFTRIGASVRQVSTPQFCQTMFLSFPGINVRSFGEP